MELPALLKIGRKWWSKVAIDSVSAEYKKWRHKFILKRLRLLSLVVIVVFVLNTFIFWAVAHSALIDHPDYNYTQQSIKITAIVQIIMSLEFASIFVLLRVSWIRRYPLLILLWLTWTSFITSQVITAIFLKQADFEVVLWMMYFFGAAILLPVRWQWHLLSQIIILGAFCFCYFVLRLEVLILDAKDAEIQTYYILVYGYIFLVVCSIANTGVFLYERLIQQEFELRRQLKLFVHTVSHDLRSPMLGIVWLLKSLRNPAAKETVVENATLDQIIDSSDRQLQLIDSLLEVHNTATKGISLRPRPVHLDALVESVITEMKPLLSKQQATVSTIISTKSLVNIDPLQIRRVYENLIINALESNQSGLHITIKTENNLSLNRDRLKKSNGRWLYCTVSDDGIGIPLAKQSHIFDLYTGATSNKQSLNVGLGLYICRQIINAHGGKIGTNNSSSGANFWFALPTANNSISLNS